MIYLGADYAGYKHKQAIITHLMKRRIKFHDLGCHSDRVKNDFPDYAWPAAKKVSRSKNDRAILICGTGIGMSVAANRFRHIRAALVYSVKQAKVARQFDNVNVLCLSAWSTDNRTVLKIVNAWLATPFEKLPRRLKRFTKLDAWRT